MSMPRIPDITPHICINREQAIDMLLMSIAMEEMSLSRLMDAENEKIKFAIECGSVPDTLKVNSSVNSTLINMIKMQMLLQFKLENVERMIPKVYKPDCRLRGCGAGYTTCGCDEFADAWAKLCVCGQGNLTYCVEKQSATYRLAAREVHIECPKEHCAVAYGNGCVDKTQACGRHIEGDAWFKLHFFDGDERGFQIEIVSKCGETLNHVSGFVSVEDCADGLRMVRL